MRRLIKQIWQLPRVALKQFASDILRLAFLLNRPRRLAQKGFVLPTTVLLTIMVALTVTALTYRTFVRSEQAIGQREQRVIVNAATPAIDRAKAKIEFLFQSDTRFPSGLPSSDKLYDLLSTRLAAGKDFAGYGVTGGQNRNFPYKVSLLAGGKAGSFDPYTLEDETRVDINEDGILDNAWTFTSEGKTLVYSILVDDEVFTGEANPPGAGEDYVRRPYATANASLKDADPIRKANSLITRTGPLATTEATAQCQGALSQGGWQVVAQGNSSQLQKNFQINAFVANDSDVNQTFETLEFQQSRQAERGNKWGAWFRYDLEIPLGTQTFNWNGAMHTDSNLIITNRADRALNLYMVSSPASCVYSRESSEITMAESVNTQGQVTFQGQAINGAMREPDSYGSSGPDIHVFTANGAPPTTNNLFTAGNHSVTGGNPFQVSANALKIFTSDITEHIRNPGIGSWNRRVGWADGIFNSGGRIINDRSADSKRPYLDDFYRADNRWGPKPRYDSTDDYKIPATKTIGDTIEASDLPNSSKLTDAGEGLDGYWERQAMQKGLRLIVGQRLELGNANGWNSNPVGANNSSCSGTFPCSPTSTVADPLYPPNKHKGAAPITTDTELTPNGVIGGDHEYLQRKALRDNLAAVQGMVVYHYQIDNGRFPAACVALTAHPGTRQTIFDSRNFGTWLGPTTPTPGVKTDFLNGKGTNGWEFQFYNSATFATAIGAGQPLGNALRNLAYFAGDPQGGAPSFKPVQDLPGADAVAHPFPYMAMWGDFSPLRRIFAEYLDDGVSYTNLSPADQATLHSAACTLGMLAYNLKSAEDEFQYLNTPGSGSALLLAVADALIGGTTPNPITVEALDRWSQVNRDRKYGFALPPTTIPLTCDPDQFIGGVPGTDPLNSNRRDALANQFCARTKGSKYPSLFYLFPKQAHGQTGTGDPDAIQPPAEEYIDQSSGTKYIATANPTSDDLYQSFNPAAISLSPRALGGADWVLKPESTTGPITTTNLESPPENAFKINAGTGVLRVLFLDKGVFDGREQLNNRVLDIDLKALTTRRVGSGTAADFWLSANLENQAEGIVYAFREDAVREDEIVRPKSTSTITSDRCSEVDGSQFRIEFDEDCLMQVRYGGTIQDPPLAENNSISLKPVDFIADPERRTHGFRMRTATGEPADFSGDNYVRKVGMTFVTDNSVYIMGDFNLHSTNGTRTGLVEEFTDKLNANFSNFYTRTEETLNTAVFANLNEDHWRPVEILADAISILSNTFRDGVVQDGFLRARPAATPIPPSVPDSSYMNQNRPIFEPANLGDNGMVRENDLDPTSPIYIDRNGTYYVKLQPGGTPVVDAPQPFYTQYTTAAQWSSFTTSDADRRRNVQIGQETYVNALLVAGIVPKRPNQGYGGLHNYPRFVQNWNNINMYISGAFFQLNFATAATGPYEQDAWEAKSIPVGGDVERIGYYRAPQRRWGYDVGLLYVPPAPIARRFVNFGIPRSEYYREIPADDPYSLNLRCARKGSGGQAFVRVFNTNNICPKA